MAHRIPKKVTWYLIAILACAGVIALVPSGNGLTPAGVRMLGVFLGAIILWLTVNDRIGVLFLSLVGVVAVVGMPYQEAAATSILNDSTVICFLALLLAEGLNATGAMEYLSKWLLSRKVIEGHPYVFILFIMVAGILLGMLTAVGMAVVFLFAFARQLLKAAQIEPGNPIFLGTMLGILWTYVYGEMMLPYKSVTAQFIVGVGAGMGYTIQGVHYMMLGVPLCILALAFSLLLIRLFLHPTAADFSRYEVATMREELKEKPLSRAGKLALGCTCLTFLLLLVQSMTTIPWVANYLAPLGSVVCYLIPLVLLCLIHTDGRPLLDLSDGVKRVSWDMVFFLANIMLFATTISRPEFGITACLQKLLTDAISFASPLLLFAVAILVVGLLTNITSNYALASLGAAIFTPLLAAMGLSPEVTTVAIGQIAFCAFLTPAGGLGPAVIFGSGEVSVKEAFLPNVVMLLLMMGSTIVLGYLMALA